MAIIRSFRELIAYQKARLAAKEVFALSKGFPVAERFSLTDQIRRRARAIGAMIAEAWARRCYEAAFINKINEAQGVANETQSWLDSALDCGYLSAGDHARMDALFQELGAMLQGMIDRSDTFCLPAKR
jgi:four helix bundle protein